MAKQKIDYYDIVNATNLPTLEFKNIDEFIKLAESKDVQAMFISHAVGKNNGDSNDQYYFMILLNNIFYIIRTEGYKTAHDYLDAVEKGFGNAAEYYEATRLGFHDFREFEECRKSGIQDRALYVKMLKLGFAEHFEEFKTAVLRSPKILPEGFDISKYDSAIQLCMYALEHGFKDYGDFSKATLQGFADQHTYEQAKAKGFSFAYEYLNAMKMGFDVLREYQEAMHLKITSKYEYNVYTHLKKLAKNVYSIDQAQLMEALMTHETGRSCL